MTGSLIHNIKKICRGPYRSYVQPVILKSRLKNADEIKLIIGASGTFQPGWIATDEHQLNLLKPEVWDSYLKGREVSTILAEHVWEHLDLNQGVKAAQTCYRFLKKGGRLRVAVPDGHFPDPVYINHVKPMGIGPGADDHKVLYTYQTLGKVFEDAGFKSELLEYFDENGQFHNMTWNKQDGMVSRSLRYDERNEPGKIRYTSIILDAIKE
jgi:predicted SAM-dependent methyltransferase